MATIKDIARLSGYSIGTVSRVINNHPDVSEEARIKITEIVKQTNFQPNSNAKALKNTGFTAVTILVKGVKNTFLETILEEVQELLRDHGEAANVVFLDELANEVETAVQLCAERKPKGLIFLGGNLDFFQKRFSAISVPAVLIATNGSGLGYDNLSSFTTDDMAAASKAVEHLMKLGHRKIGIIGGSGVTDHGYVSTERLIGALRQLENTDSHYDVEKYFEPSLFSAESGYQAAMKLMERSPEITGIFCLSDMIALGAMRAARDRGLKVPDDISVIGFDGIEYTRYSVPRLTTIRQDVKELARKGVEDLLFRLSYSRSAVHEKVSYELVLGESVAKPAQNRKKSKKHIENQ